MKQLNIQEFKKYAPEFSDIDDDELHEIMVTIGDLFLQETHQEQSGGTFQNVQIDAE